MVTGPIRPDKETGITDALPAMPSDQARGAGLATGHLYTGHPVLALQSRTSNRLAFRSERAELGEGPFVAILANEEDMPVST